MNNLFDKKDVYSWSNAEEAKEYLGKDCYFAHSVGGLSEHIKTGVMGILKDIFNSNYDAVSCAFGDGTSTWGLCLPADKVIEVEEPKKWRPFTLEEFLNKFSVGTKISMREKDQTRSFYCLFGGYQTDNDQTEKSHILVIGSLWYSLNELLNNYEYLDEHGNWQPFGVKE